MCNSVSFQRWMSFSVSFLLTISLFLAFSPVDVGGQGQGDRQTPWTNWSGCSRSCGGGVQSRFRDCIDHIYCGGARETVERSCNNVHCPVHGEWEMWESWTGCPVTCGGGISTRERTCDAPVPDFGGRFCVGGDPANTDLEGVEWKYRVCNNNACPVDGAWTKWSLWSNCTTTCGGGASMRTRTCTNPAPVGEGSNCVGRSADVKTCNVFPRCPENGGWSQWSAQWSYCSISCSGGVRVKTRSCTHPFPLHGGKDCVGNSTRSEPCNQDVLCPVDGAWSQWGLWSACTSSCLGGKKSRGRSCTDPVPANGGFICLTGKSTETATCNDQVPCQVDGRWALWTTWTECGLTCAGGTRARARSCTNPAPALGGVDCAGLSIENVECNQHIGCPVDGNWAMWTKWTACSSPCGGGQQTRDRTCSNPPTAHGGTGCAGPTADARDCNTQACP